MEYSLWQYFDGKFYFLAKEDHSKVIRLTQTGWEDSKVVYRLKPNDNYQFSVNQTDQSLLISTRKRRESDVKLLSFNKHR